jgi:hypothetical protein
MSLAAAECASRVEIVMVTFSPHTLNKMKGVDLTEHWTNFYDQCLGA